MSFESHETSHVAELDQEPIPMLFSESDYHSEDTGVFSDWYHEPADVSVDHLYLNFHRINGSQDASQQVLEVPISDALTATNHIEVSWVDSEEAAVEASIVETDRQKLEEIDMVDEPSDPMPSVVTTCGKVVSQILLEQPIKLDEVGDVDAKTKGPDSELTAVANSVSVLVNESSVQSVKTATPEKPLVRAPDAPAKVQPARQVVKVQPTTKDAALTQNGRSPRTNTHGRWAGRLEARALVINFGKIKDRHDYETWLSDFEHAIPAIITMGNAPHTFGDRTRYNDIVTTVANLYVHGKQEPMERFAMSLGFQPAELFEAWRQGNGGRLFMHKGGQNEELSALEKEWVICKEQETWALRNLETMMALEHRERGLSLKINQQFGIMNFARNTPGMLADMYSQRIKKPAAPYVLSVGGRSDYNNAFGYEAQVKWASTLYWRLKCMGVRYEEYECPTPESLNGVITGAVAHNKKYGAKIAHLLLESHGQTDSLRDYLTRSNVTLLRPLRGIMAATAEVLVPACNTGRADKYGKCLAQDIANATGRPTTGADRSTEPRVRIARGTNPPRLDVEFLNIRTGLYDSSIKHRYLPK